MSDETRPDRDAAEPHEDAVRRLLAEARHEERLPPRVAARLDTLLGELVEARSRDTGVASLTHRRRRRGRLLLAAAAAAVVVAVAVPQLRDSSSDTTASDSTAGARSGAESATEQNPGVAAPDAAAGGVIVLGEDTFDAEVARIPDSGQSPYASDLSLTGLDCALGSYGAGRLLPALYDGKATVLALRPAADGVRRIDLLACGTAEVLRTTTVPAP